MGDLSIAKKDMTQQASFLSTSTVSRCEIIPCDGRDSCHTPYQILQYPFGTPLSEPLEKLKKIVQLNCSPEKVKYLFEQIEAGKAKDIDFEEAMKTVDSPTPESHFVPAPKPNCRLPPCEGHPGCHSVDEVLQYPFGTPLPPNLVKLKELLEQNCSPKKVKFLFDQIETGNLKDIDWEHIVEIPTDSLTDVSPSLNVAPTPKSNCRFPPCQGHPGCHPPDEILQYPFGTSLSPDLEELKRLIEQNDCPEKVKRLYAKIAAGNMKNVHWKEAAETPTDCPSNKQPPLSSVPTPKINCQLPASQERPSYHSPDEISQPQKKIVEQNDCPEKLKRLFDEMEVGNRNNAKSQNLVVCSDSPHETSQQPLKTHLPQCRDEPKSLEENGNSKKNGHLFEQRDSGFSKNIGFSEVTKPFADFPKTPTCVFSSCHLPDEVLQYPYGTPLPPHLVRLKELLEQNSDPQKVKQLFQKIEAGDLENLDYEAKGACQPCPNFKPYAYPNYKIPCPNITCEKKHGCHSPDEVLQYPFGTPLSQSLENLKKLIELNSNPKKVKKLYSQMRDGDNFCNLDWEGALECPTETYPENYHYPNKKLPCPNITCEKKHGCHSPDEVLQYPFGTPLSQSLEKLKKLIELNCNPKKVKKLYSQMRDGKDLCNLDCEGALENPTETYPKNYSNTKLPCPNITCEKKHGCHSPDEVLQYPFGTPLSQSLEKLKKLIELNCNPKKVKKLYSQMRDGKDLCNLDCEGALENPSETYPKNYSNTKLPCPNITCEKKHGCHSPDEVLQYPFGTPLSQSLEKLKKLIELNFNPKKVKKLYSRMRDGDDFCNFDCEGALENPTETYSENDPNTKIPCPNITCEKKHGCNSPDEDSQYLFGTPLTQSLENIKKKVKKLYSQIQDDDDFCSLDCEGALENPTETSCNSPDEDSQYPFGTPLTQSLEKIKYKVKKLYTQIQDDDDSCNAFGTPITQSLEKIKKEVKKLYTQIQDDDDFCNLDCKGAIDTSSDVYPDYYENSKVIPCRTPTCQKNPGCHLAGEVIQYAYGTPLPQQLIKLKTFLEQNSNPKEVKDLLRQIEAGNLENLDFVEAFKTSIEIPPSYYPNYESISPTISTCRIPSCQGHPNCHLPDEILQYPFGTPLPEHLEKLKKILAQNNNPKKVKELFRQIEAGNLENLDWNGAIETTSCQPTRACDIPSCHGHDSVSLDKCSFGTPLPPHLLELKKLLEENCSPKIVKHLMKQIESGNLKNMKSVGCGESTGIPIVISPDVCPPSVSTATDSTSLYMPADQKPTSIVLKPGSFPPGASPIVFPPGALTPGVYPPGISPRVLLPPIIPIVLPPEVYAPAPKDEDCATCHKPKYRDGIKMKCACSGKKKTAKIKPCPCELHKVPMSKDEPGLKIATYSQGAQCCICDDYFAGVKKSGKDVIFKLGQSAPSIIGTSGGPVSSGVQGGTGCIICPTGLPCSSDHTTCPKLTTITISPIPLGYYGQPDAKTEMGELEIIGPQGGYVMIGPDGISTQSGIKVIKFSTGTGTDSDNVGSESNSKKKKNCLCSNKRGKKKNRKVVCQCPSESDLEPLLLYTYEDFEEARKLSKQYKSDLTQTTSGFKFDKKKRPEPDPAAEYTVEDAIRDYAVIKPDFIRSLVPPGVRRTNKKDCACEEDVGVGQYEILKKNAKGVWELENPVPVHQDVPLKGLKFTIGGKGSGSKGLSGICCFEMYQDS